MPDTIYLDHHATTPCDPRVVAAMAPFWTDNFANPASPHAAGRRAADSVEKARLDVAGVVGARASEIVFTGGATESNNLAILGAARAWGTKRRRIVTCATEHRAVLEPCRWLGGHGFEVVVLPVDRVGRVDLNAAERSINDETLLVSVGLANGEIGTIQPMREISELARARGALLHCDGAQAVGKIAVDVNELGVDLLSLSAHKIYGPKGVGALYVRGGKRLRLEPLSLGGSQELALRAGTLNVAGIVGLGAACELCRAEMHDESARLAALRDAFETAIIELVPEVRRNGDLNNRLPHNSSLTFPDVEAEMLLANCPDLMLSSSSACTSGALEPSPVLTAIGLGRDQAFSTVRVGLGRFNTPQEIALAASQIAAAFLRLRALL